jgi:hypothetical protein
LNTSKNFADKKENLGGTSLDVKKSFTSDYLEETQN